MRHRPVKPAGHPIGQGPRPQGGLLPPEPAQPDKPRRHGPHLRRRHLLPGLPRRPADQVCPVPRPVQQLPHQAVLHQQHPDHPAERPRLQPLHDLTDAQCQVRW